jgi:ABC-type sugar transport system permease subunit
VGLLLTVPALVLLVTDNVLPSVTTLRWSFQDVFPLDPGATTGVGTDNYERAFDQGLAGRFGYALAMAVVPIAAVAVVAPLLAWTAHRGGRVTRWITRGVLVLPLAIFAPFAVTISLARSSTDADPSTPTVRSIFWLASFGVTVALGVTVFLAVLRRREGEKRQWPAAIAVGVLGVLAVLAVAVQEFTAGALVRTAGDGPPALPMYQQGFAAFRFGAASVYATLMLAVLVVLGGAAGLLIVLSGLRMEVDDGPDRSDRGIAPRAVWSVVAAVLLLGVLAVVWFANKEWLGGSTNTTAPGRSTGEVLVNTWLPPLVSALLGVVVAALAAFGISGLRPFGRYSELLLLPFAPFLLVGISPLALTGYDELYRDGQLDTFWGAVPPILGPVVLYVLAIVLRGQTARRERLRQAGRPVNWARTLLPVLPMAGIAFLVTWVVRAHDVLWPLISTRTEPVASSVMLRIVLSPFDTDVPYGLLMPVWLIALLVLIGVAAQLFYLDRITIRAGKT